jgi:hypothetical protein
MVPETWIIVDDVPKTSSGKINRPLLTQFVEAINATEYRRILDLAISDSTEDDANLPATPMERQLQRILCRVLNRPAEQIVMNRTSVVLKVSVLMFSNFYVQRAFVNWPLVLNHQPYPQGCRKERQRALDLVRIAFLY